MQMLGKKSKLIFVAQVISHFCRSRGGNRGVEVDAETKTNTDQGEPDTLPQSDENPPDSRQTIADETPTGGEKPGRLEQTPPTPTDANKKRDRRKELIQSAANDEFVQNLLHSTELMFT